MQGQKEVGVVAGQEEVVAGAEKANLTEWALNGGGHSTPISSNKYDTLQIA